MLRISTDTMFSQGALNMDNDQSALLQTQLQLSTGLRINSPADDPGGAAQVASLTNSVSQLSQYSSNQSQATSVLSQGESTLQQFNNALQSANTYLVQAGDGSYSNTERSSLAASLQSLLGQMVSLANTTDASGSYLFAGSRQASPPFAQSGSTVTYQGDSNASSLEVAAGKVMQTTFTGDSVFMKIPQGNGSFVTAAASGNTGTATIDPGSVTDPSQLTGDNYTISFASGGSGTTYTVQDTTNNTTVSSGSYSGSGTLSFDGMSVDLSGAPANGDTFTISPAGNQSIFATMQQAITALQSSATSGSSSAQFSSARQSAEASLSQAMNHISLVQSNMGSQVDSLQAYQSVNQQQSTAAQTQLSNVQSLDYATAATNLSEQQLSYQAAMQSYAEISKLSLFNYL
jgi:flagellar hook-associated protein 3 FlgL